MVEIPERISASHGMTSAPAPRPLAAPIATTARELLAGRYLRLEQLGEGGMGIVHRVQDSATGKQLAFKQLLSAEGSPKQRVLDALFEREYHTLVRLKHPRIIEVYDYGLTDAGPYYTMELLDGGDLRALAPLPYRDACGHLRDLASSLALIHAHRLVHRDVCLRNVRLGADSRAKLIDFGALTSFGTAADVIGTPPCTSPEVLRRAPLDQRADLFALGAVAYFLLTGQHAYAARQLADLPRAWEQPLLPPSAHAPDLPRALDELVLSLLSVDRLGRPSHAAQVIDRLTAIAGLDPEPAELAADSYLQSGHLVGRDDELTWIRRRAIRAVQGRGAEILLEGPAGIGRTRLMHEAALDAQLRGLCVLRADGQATAGELATARVLALGLVTACPELALRSAAEHAPQLARLSFELGSKLGVSAPAELSDDPAERRARMQTALRAWFLAVAREQPLLVAVDNLQAVDDSSAAFLATLGHEARTHALIVLATQRSGEPALAVAPVRALRKRSALIALAPLGAEPCGRLVSSVFGSAANVGRVSALLHRKSAGNPQLCMDLAQLLVHKGIAKYQGGSWVLPLDVSDDELPSQVAEIHAARLSALSPPARELCEALSIHGKPVSLEHALAACRSRDEAVAHAALDELCAEQILLVAGADYRFCQETLREAVRAGMDPALRRIQHLRAAEVLLEGGGASVGAQVDAATHLIRAGRERSGADILAAAGREFLRDRATPESAEQVVKALVTAIAVYEAQGRSKHERAGLMFALIPLAFFVDWRVTLEHGERALRLGLDITGLALAQRLRAFLPRKLALMTGLFVASVRLALQRRRGVAYSLPEAIGSFCAIIPATIGTHNLCFDVAAVQRLAGLLEPLALFGEGHIATAMGDWARGQLSMGQSREAQARVALERLQRAFQGDAIKQVLGEGHWQSMYGGILFSLGLLAPYWFGGRALELADELEDLGVRVWAMAAAQVRLLHHALRGESEPTQHQREQVELFAVQGSTTWQAEMFWPVLLLGSDALTGDVLAVRRAREQLARRARDAPSLQPYAELADAVYLSLRGEYAAAIARFEQLLPRLAIKERVAWALARCAFAEALNGAGEHARAKDVLEQVLAALDADDAAVVGRHLEPRRQLALTEALLGHHQRAAQALDALLALHGGQDQPLLIGLLHKARAEVALLAGDAALFERHAAECERCFRATQNASLIAQWERLIERAVGAGVRERSEALPRSERPAAARAREPSSLRTLRELVGAADPAAYAVRLLLQRGAARAVHLYALRDGCLQLAASSAGGEPAREHEVELRLRLERTQRELTDEALASAGSDQPADTPTPAEQLEGGRPELTTTFLDSAPPERGASAVRTMLLQHGEPGSPAVIVGGVILELAANTASVDPTLIDAVASVLYERRGREREAE